MQVFSEQDSLEHDGILQSGYAQSKWVAEKLVAFASSRGLPVTIHRLGRITGNSKTGVWNTNDFMCSMIKCCIQLGSVPKIDGLVDMTPVDYISQAIWQSKVAPAVQGRVFAVRSMLALVSLPLAYLIAGPLADQVFEPLLTPTGLLAGSVGKFIGVGRGYGIALLFVVMGMLTMLAIKYI